MEARGGTIITTSASMLALIVAVSALLLGKDKVVLASAASPLLVVASLITFVIANVLAIFVQNYSIAHSVTAWEKVPAAILFRLMERADFERREPRCRICRDSSVRSLVNELLDWRGVPIILGRGKTHRITLTEILAWLEPLNEGRGKRDQITYDVLWSHFQRHYSLAGIAAYWRTRMGKEFKKALRG